MAALTFPDKTHQIAEKQAFIEQIQEKMRRISKEFAAGEINRDQFHRLYDHYQSQVMFTLQILAETDGSLLSQLPSGETIAIRKQFMAKARAMAVYYHTTGLLLETIGDFDVPTSVLGPLLNDLNDRILSGNAAEPQLKALGREWVLVVTGRFTTSIMQFSNEPTTRQISIIGAMHHDFEAANDAALRSGRAEASTLVFPFQSVVRKSMGMK